LNRNLRPGRDAEGKIFQGCHAPNCHAVPFDDQGRPVPVAASRWFCGKHEDQAQAGDLDPPDDLRPRLDFATMRLLPGRAEEERERRDWEARIAAINERDKAKRDQAERMRAIAEARRANMKPPVGFGPR
jgi:hypothetical protein